MRFKLPNSKLLTFFVFGALLCCSACEAFWSFESLATRSAKDRKRSESKIEQFDAEGVKSDASDADFSRFFAKVRNGQFYRISPTAYVYYDFEHRIPRLGIERLEHSMFVDTEVKKRTGHFMIDKRIPKPFRVRGQDYAHCSVIKIDRGHLLPAGNYVKRLSYYNRTFNYWNIFPQNSHLNRGTWMVVENFARDLVISKRVDKLFVYSGTLFIDREEPHRGRFKQYHLMGNSSVSIPDAVFKIFLAIKDDQFYVHAVKFPNTVVQIKSDNVMKDYEFDSIEELEKLSGFELPREMFAKSSHRPRKLCEHMDCRQNLKQMFDFKSHHHDYDL